MWIVPISIGLSIVLQGTLNRRVTDDWGLTATVFFNGIVFFLVSAVVYAVVKFWPNAFPEFVRLKQVQNFSWWYWLPGIFGFMIVFGAPIALQRMSALSFFLFVIASQILFSLLWDVFVEKRAINLMTSLGALLALAGAVLVTISQPN